MIKLNNIYKVYENGTVAIRNVSLEFPQAGMVAITGTSGCGKSTLLNLLSNNDIPSKGELLYNNKPYGEYSKDILIKDFAYIYQDFKLIDNLTVYQNIMIGHELANKDIDYDFILRVAEKLKLSELLDQKIYALSGGQQQRVAIARALARNPKVIFADEPTGNLDSSNSKNVYEILSKIAKEILVVIVSHDKDVAKYADRIMQINNGKIVGDKTPQEMLEVEPATAQGGAQKQLLDTNIGYKKKTAQNTQKISKKPSKIGTKSVFSYAKGKNCTRKKEGLSLKSTIGLTIGLNNNSIVKKVILTLISVVMLALMFFTSAVIFSSQEDSFCYVMRRNKVPYVTMDIWGRHYKLSIEDKNKLCQYVKEKTGTDLLPTTYSSYLHYNFSKIIPESFDKDNYDIYKNLLRFDNTVYADDAKDIGVKMIMGVSPKINSEGQDEIAISKTCYDYLMKEKRFRNAEGEIVDFSTRDLLGNYIEEFRVKITGVFEDFNDWGLDENINFGELQSYNNLTTTIIRPKATLADARNLMVGSSNINLYNSSYGWGMGGYFYNFCTNNDSVKKYYYDYDWLKNSLARNEVYVSESFQSNYEIGTGKKLNVGDTISFDLIKKDYSVGNQTIEETYQSNINFKVKGIFESLNADATYHYDVIVNEQLFEEWIAPRFDGTYNYAINSKIVTPNFLKDLRKFIYNKLSPEIAEITANDWQHEEFAVRFFMPKHDGNIEYNNDVTDIARFGVALPLFVLATIAFGVLVVVLVSDMIKGKGREILILRSLGAKTKDLWNLFGVVSIVMLVVLLIFGCLAGSGLIYGLNIFWTKVLDVTIYNPYFYVSPLSIFVMSLSIIALCGGVIWHNMNKLNGKNLRKSFQKQKR